MEIKKIILCQWSGFVFRRILAWNKSFEKEQQRSPFILFYLGIIICVSVVTQFVFIISSNNKILLKFSKKNFF
jgi:hypothetical protein